MKTQNNFTIREVQWAYSKEILAKIRTEVFVIEQKVPEEMEWDTFDESAIHLLAFEGNFPVGCARILNDGIIGRMAVLVNYRRRGIGNALLKHAIAVCRRHGWPSISLSAQTHAISFYEKAGFEICSNTYLDAGIQHCSMRLEPVPLFAEHKGVR